MTKIAKGTLLCEKALLTKLVVSQWSGTVIDKTVTAEIAVAHGTDELIGQFRKNLVRSIHLDSYRKHGAKTRELHYRFTLPWADDGLRMLPVTRYDEYRSAMSSAIDEGNAFASAFVNEYDECVERAKSYELKDLAKVYEFPTKEQIAGKFGIHTRQMPIPAQGQGWPTVLGNVETELNTGYQEMVDNALEAADKELWVRLHRYVSRMHRRLSDPASNFNKSLVGNLRRMVDEIPKMNLSDNADINQMITDIENCLTGEEPEALREDPLLRKQVADDAGDILEKMGAFYQPPVN